MFNSGIRGKRASDGTGFLSTQEQFVQKTFTIPTITSFSIAGSDDLALDPAGGQTVEINGSGFTSGATVVVGGASIGVVTFVDSTKLTFTAPTKSSGSYTVFVSNPNGGTAILTPGLVYSGFPTFTTEAGSLGSYYETTEIDEVIEATEGEDPITYTIVAGSLPTGATLNSAGYITGTSPVDESSNTYTFTVQATDAENQDSTRQFSLTINVDVVTWVTPSEGTIQLDGNEEMTNVTLLATSAAGYNIDSYTANTLPTGVLLSGNTVYGTPSTEETVVTTFTATSNVTNRTSTRTVTWVVSLGDAFFNQTTLLLNGDNNTFITDASTNAFTITPNGDTRPSAFSPYNTGWSLYQPSVLADYLNFGTGDWTFSGDFTIDAWVYYTSASSGDTSLYVLNVGSAYLAFNISMTAGVYNIYLNSGSPTSPISHGIVANQWTHVAMVRSGSTITLYTNGVAKGTITSSATLGYNNPTINRCGGGVVGEIVARYISNLRILRGTAIDFSTAGIPTSPVSVSTANQILLTAYGNRSADFNTTVAAKTVTVTGSPKVTAFAPFTDTDTSTGSGYFDGTGDYLTVPDNAAFDLPGDFTAEFFVYATAGNARRLFQLGDQRSSYNGLLIYSTTGNLIVVYINGAVVITGPTLVPYQWVHVACVREGTGSNNLKLYVNGSLAGQVTNNVSFTGVAGNGISLGAEYNGSFAATFETYISDFRLVKGTAVYSGATYTVPTTSLPAISGTSLLTLQNRISYNNSQPIDESGIKNVITRVGNASAGTFSPHVPTGWSAYFDGTGDYLTAPIASSSISSSTSFTIEFFVYWNVLPTTYTMFMSDSNGNSSKYIAYNVGAGFLDVQTGTSAATGASASFSPVVNTWYHLAFVRDGTTLTIYVNGSALSMVQPTQANAFLDTGSTLYIGRWAGTTPYGMNGYISNLRIVKGTAIVPPAGGPTAPLTAVSGTSLLTLRGPSFTDDGPKRFAITRNGDTKITPFSPFKPHTIAPDSYSVYFDGNGDYLTTPSNVAFAMGTGNITAECWFYSTSSAQHNWLFDFRTSGSESTTRIYAYIDSGTLKIGFGALDDQSSGTTILNAWNHVAVVRSGSGSNNVAVFLNGTRTNQFTQTTDFSTNTLIHIGRRYILLSTDYMVGYISNVRAIKGTAVYDPASTTITVPTAPLTAIANTSLLTCQSSTVIDNSSNAFAITVNGNSQPTQFNPFGETVATGVEYAPASHGGSVYFDGSDYLQMPSNSEFNLGTGNFTMEFWVYPTVYNAYYITRQSSNTGWNNIQWYLYVDGTGTLILAISNGSGAQNAWAGGITPLNAWTHVAVVRDSTAANGWRIFINGTSIAYANGTGISFSMEANATGQPLNIGGFPGWGHTTGYISNFRLIKGRALYTSSFVPPQAPADPVSGTTLLTCDNNAAIYDATGRNVLETAGNARVVNGVKKYGSGAMYFDGNDYVKSTDSSLFEMGSEPFTIECWAYFSSFSATNGNVIVSKGLVNSISTEFFSLQATNSAGLNFYWRSGTQIITGPTLLVNQWYHLAVVRDGNSFTLFVNGVGGVPATSATTLAVGGSLIVGSQSYSPGATDRSMTGYIDDLRITKGVARTITLPSSAFRTK